MTARNHVTRRETAPSTRPIRMIVGYAPAAPRHSLTHADPPALSFTSKPRQAQFRRIVMLKRVIKACSMAAAAALLLAAPAHSQTTFKVSQVFPSTHWHWTEGMKIFTEAAEAASGGKIKFEVYHAGQLGKETTSTVTSGLAQLGLLVPSYEPAKLPLTSVMELPGFHSSSCEGTAKYWQLAKDGGALQEAEYKRLGVRPLYVILLAPYQVMTTTRKVAGLEDLSGLKIRALGAAMDQSVRLLGGIPVRVTSNELYDALTRGTVDGGFWPIGSTRTVGLDNTFKFAVQGPRLGAGSTFFAINEKVWSGLDAETKKALAEAGEKTQKHLCAYLDRVDAEQTEWLVKERGLTVTKLPEQELKRWHDKVAGVAEDWAKTMDSTNRPGSALLKALREAR